MPTPKNREQLRLFATRMITKQPYYMLGETLASESMLCLQAYRCDNSWINIWILDESWNSFLGQSAGLLILSIEYLVNGYHTLLRAMLLNSLHFMLPPSSLISYLASLSSSPKHVVPAQAGIPECVVPAQAGIHSCRYFEVSWRMVPRLRGDDKFRGDDRFRLDDKFRGNDTFGRKQGTHYEINAISIVNQCYQFITLAIVIFLQTFSENNTVESLLKWSMTYFIISFLQTKMQQTIDSKMPKKQAPEFRHALNVFKVLSQFFLQLALMWLFPRVWYQISIYFNSSTITFHPEELLHQPQLCQKYKEQCCLNALSIFNLHEKNASRLMLQSAYKNMSRHTHPDLTGQTNMFAQINNAKEIAANCLKV